MSLRSMSWTAEPKPGEPKPDEPQAPLTEAELRAALVKIDARLTAIESLIPSRRLVLVVAAALVAKVLGLDADWLRSVLP